MADDWNLYVDTFASRSVSSEALVPSLAAFIHQAVNQKDFIAYVDCLSATDIRDDLSLIDCPTLVVEFDSDPLRDAEQSQLFASFIRGAELAIVPNISGFAFLAQFADAIERFEDRLDQTDRTAVDSEQKLSPREIEVLKHVAAGRSNPEIAEILAISRSTVDRHVANVYQKADLHGRVEATHWAIAHGIVPPDSRT